VSVLAGLGNGILSAGPNFETGIEPATLSAGDLNGDSDPDLVVGNNDWHGNHISVLTGLPGVDFGAATSYYAGKDPVSVATAGLSGDGAPDVAIANNQNGVGHVTVLAGSGNGTLPVTPEFPAGLEARGLAAGDFNADGIPDLAIASYFSVCTVTVLLGQGGGIFDAPVTYHTDHFTETVAVGDFNGDGTQDLVTPYALLLGNGDGTFQDAVPHGGSVLGVAIGDFNEDGFLDVVTVGASNTYVKVILGNGNGTFQAPVLYTVIDPVAVAVGDFNADGAQDVVTANESGHGVSVLLGNGDGTFQPPVNYTVGNSNYPHHVDIADFNSDGRQDLVVTSNKVHVFWGNGDGTFQPTVTYTVTASSVTVGDFDNDGHPDIAVASSGLASNGTFPSVKIMRSNGDGTFEPPEFYLASLDPIDILAVDLNSDAKLDLAVANLLDTAFPAPGTVSVLWGTGDGFQAIRAFLAGPAPTAITIVDLNADGLRDILVVNSPESGTGSVSALVNSGGGVFLPYVNYPVGSYPTAVTVADLNQDENVDVAVTNQGSNSVSILLGVGDATFLPAVEFPAGSLPYGVAVADFDGDGNTDLAVANNIGAGTVSVLRGQGNGTFLPPGSYAVGSFPRAVATADFNLDGKADIAVTNHSGGIVSLLLDIGGAFEIHHYVIDHQPRSLAIIDADGDGWLDLAALHAGGVTVLRNAADWFPAPIGDGPRVSPMSAGHLVMSEPSHTGVMQPVPSGDLRPVSIRQEISWRPMAMSDTTTTAPGLTSSARLHRMASLEDAYSPAVWQLGLEEALLTVGGPFSKSGAS
jgi:hypothetical protein